MLYFSHVGRDESRPYGAPYLREQVSRDLYGAISRMVTLSRSGPAVTSKVRNTRKRVGSATGTCSMPGTAFTAALLPALRAGCKPYVDQPPRQCAYTGQGRAG